MNTIRFVAGAFLWWSFSLMPLIAGEASRENITAAINKTLPLLQKNATTYTEERSCFTCHHQALPAMTISRARSRGFSVDDKAARAQSEFTHRYFTDRKSTVSKGSSVPGGPYTAGYALLSLAADRWEADETIDALVEYLNKTQSKDGSWRIRAHRPPLEDSHFTATAVSLHGLQNYASKDQAEQVSKRVEHARDWLVTAKPKTNEDEVFRLFGLKWSGADESVIEKAAEELMADQRDDGGWGQLADMSSDSYATGQALVALHQAGGLAISNPVHQKGIAFLLKTQLDDGSWLVKTRSKPIQKYFESGFPHEKSQFISICGTCWATMALVLASDDKTTDADKANVKLFKDKQE